MTEDPNEGDEIVEVLNCRQCKGTLFAVTPDALLICPECSAFCEISDVLAMLRADAH